MNGIFKDNTKKADTFNSWFLQCINCCAIFPFYETRVNEPCPECKITKEEYYWIRNGTKYA